VRPIPEVVVEMPIPFLPALNPTPVPCRLRANRRPVPLPDGSVGIDDEVALRRTKDPLRCEWSSMPLAAIATGVVDDVLSPEQIAGALRARARIEDQLRAAGAWEDPVRLRVRVVGAIGLFRPLAGSRAALVLHAGLLQRRTGASHRSR